MADLSPLVVPIALDALLVNDGTRLSMSYQRWQLQYQGLTTFDNPEPEPFSGLTGEFQRDPNSNGIYLHWTLPSALRHGSVGGDDGAPTFARVPNRWLVMRSCRRLGGLVYDAWVVESDYQNPNDGTSNYVVPGTATSTKIGRKIDIMGGQYVPGAAQPLYLTVIGPGEPLFAAYQPYGENVFSIHDPLSTIIDGDQLSYLVMGWYSDLSADILANCLPAEFQERLATLGWQCAGTDSAQSTLYEGMVFGITWQTRISPTASDPQWPVDARKVSIGIGNTSVDVLTAFAQKAIARAGLDLDATLLEAFQYGLLDDLSQVNGWSLLGQKIHAAWFQQRQGGYRWRLEPLTADSPAEMGERTVPTAAAVAAASQALAQLNLQQTLYDNAVRLLASQQVALYEMYWKSGKAAQLGYPQAPQSYYATQLSPAGGGIMTQVLQSQANVNAMGVNLPRGNNPEALQASVAAYLSRNQLTIPAGYQLRQFALPPFFLANDPTLMVAGLHSEGLQDDTSLLACRLSNQLVTSCTYSGTAHTVNAAQVTHLNLTNLPALTSAILGEWILLDPQYAPAGVTATYNASFPALFQQPWAQPWHPLYMEWEVAYYPIDYRSGSTENWAFNGTDFDWTGNGNSGETIRLQGRIFLSPQSTYNFKYRLLQFLESHPNAPLRNIQETIARVNDWDFLSQVMDGLSLEMLARDSTISVVPSSTDIVANGQTMAQIIGAGPKHPLLPGLPSGTPQESLFQLMRSGQMELRKLFVIDRFGQTMQLVREETATQLQPSIGRNMLPSKPLSTVEAGRFMELQPRLLQPARLDFELLNADNSPHWTAPGNNPILGWVVANHLDRSLSVYDPMGDALGELKLMIDANDRPAVQWLPAPVPNPPTFAQLQGLFPDLYAFLSPLLSQVPATLNAFLRVIDESLWGIHPLGDGAAKGLSVLCGRPLALVKAELQVTLGGLPIQDPSWCYTQQAPANAVANTPFRIRLGDAFDSQDGLLGYFQGSNYGQFNAVHVPMDISLAVPASAYIVPIGGTEANYLPSSIHGGSVQATLLLDPRGIVQAYTGILPVSRLQVHAEFVRPVLSRLQLYFRMGPLLSSVQTSVEDPRVRKLVMPVPKLSTADWSWLSGFAYAPDKVMGLADLDQSARLDNGQLVLRNGMLLLSGAMDDVPQLPTSP